MKSQWTKKFTGARAHESNNKPQRSSQIQ